MSISYTIDGEPEHEELAISFNTLVALRLQSSLRAAGLDEERAMDLAESLTFDLAMVFDQEFIRINGKKYKPRVLFVEKDGNALPGAAEFDFLHEYAASPLDDTDDLEILD